MDSEKERVSAITALRLYHPRLTCKAHLLLQRINAEQKRPLPNKRLMLLKPRKTLRVRTKKVAFEAIPSKVGQLWPNP